MACGSNMKVDRTSLATVRTPVHLPLRAFSSSHLDPLDVKRQASFPIIIYCFVSLILKQTQDQMFTKQVRPQATISDVEMPGRGKD